MLLQDSASHSGSMFVQVAKHPGFLRSFYSTGISESGRVVFGCRRVSILIIAWSMCAAASLMLAAAGSTRPRVSSTANIPSRNSRCRRDVIIAHAAPLP